MRRKAFVTMFAGLLCAVGLGSAVALAAGTDDSWGTGQANQAWSASSTSFKLTAGSLTNTCTNDSASGSSTGANPDAGLLNMNTPTFASCNFAVSTNNTNGSWQVGFWSDSQPSGCPTGITTDENTTSGDCVQIHIPQAGAKIAFGVCTLTVAPSAAADIYGKTTENPDTIAINSTVPVSGCGSVATATIVGTYTMANVNGSYLDDSSGTDDSTGTDGDS